MRFWKYLKSNNRKGVRLWKGVILLLFLTSNLVSSCQKNTGAPQDENPTVKGHTVEEDFDSDNDGISDADEINVYFTNPDKVLLIQSAIQFPYRYDRPHLKAKIVRSTLYERFTGHGAWRPHDPTITQRGHCPEA